MKFTVFIDKEREEEVIVYAREKNELIDAIQKMVAEDDILNGYKDREIVPLSLSEIESFIVEDNKIFALTEKDKLTVKSRLYILEQKLPDNFIKINKSSIANIKHIKGFDASISGTLQVKFKSGRIDYVSRRNLRSIKERLGL